MECSQGLQHLARLASEKLQIVGQILVGHRGAGMNVQGQKVDSVTENTIESFMYAKQAGLDWVEFDVQLTMDDVFVIWHDNSIRYVKDGVVHTENIHQLTRRRIGRILSSYDIVREDSDGGVYQWLNAPREITTLDQVIHKIGSLVHMDIELKIPDDKGVLGLKWKVLTMSLFFSMCNEQ